MYVGKGGEQIHENLLTRIALQKGARNKWMTISERVISKQLTERGRAPVLTLATIRDTCWSARCVSSFRINITALRLPSLAKNVSG